MKVVIASETSSYELKEAVKKHLVELGYEVLDVGAQSASDGTLYFQSASALARVIQRGEAERGIVMCGTGGGASLICNAFKGVYCVACESVFTAEKIGLINNANVLAMGAKVVTKEIGSEMAEKYLAGKWCEGFETQRRLNNERGYAEMQKIEREQ